LSLADFVAPRQCSVCGRRLHTGEKSVCPSCVLDLQLVEYADGRSGNILERTLWLKFPVERAAAFMTYDRENTQRELIRDLKYHNHPKVGLHLAPLMVQQLESTHFFDNIDVILPIPIPTARRIARGYNQSEQLAIGLSHQTGIPVDTKSLKRLKYKVSQTHLTATERQDNVRHSFRLNPNHKLEGKHVLIVDDVITSTATIQSAAQALITVPGLKISILSLAVSKNFVRNLKRSNPQSELPEDLKLFYPE